MNVDQDTSNQSISESKKPRDEKKLSTITDIVTSSPARADTQKRRKISEKKLVSTRQIVTRTPHLDVELYWTGPEDTKWLFYIICCGNNHYVLAGFAPTNPKDSSNPASLQRITFTPPNEIPSCLRPFMPMQHPPPHSSDH
jgi:hypothetical protein